MRKKIEKIKEQIVIWSEQPWVLFGLSLLIIAGTIAWVILKAAYLNK